MQYCAYVGENDSAGNSDDVSGSTSYESMRGKSPNGGGVQGQSSPGGKSKENGQKEDSGNILSRLKNFLQSHPDSRGKIQKTLEDWMLLNSTTTSTNNVSREDTTTTAIPPTTTSTSIDGIEHGTIRRRRQAVDIRPDTESGENGAFEDESTNDNVTESDNFILPHSNISVIDLLGKPVQTPQSIWKEQHSQHSGVINSSITGEDGSMSESESSFSSSEEALLKCEGIIASFKIPNEGGCVEDGSFDDLVLNKNISGLESNSFTFQVQERDYYYFIFGSENERETNLVRTKFELEKMEYQLPEPVKNCTNVKECHIKFGFVSSEKVKLEY